MATPTSIVRYPGPGCVVEFMLGNKPVLAWTLEEQSGRLRLLTIHKREVKLASNRLLPWSGPQYGPNLARADIAEHLARHEAAREAAAASADALEIWELAQGEVARAGVEWFAELIWDKREAAELDKLAGLGRALLECKTHFKFTPPDFEIHPAEKVETRLRELELTRERERVATTGWQFFQELWAVHSRRQNAVKTALEPELAAKLEALLRRRIAQPPGVEDHEDAALWKIVAKGLPEDPHLALLLAQAWGILPAHYNYLYDQAGYEPGDAWSERYAEDAAAVRARFQELQRPPAPWRLLSIDSETTQDVDDAFEVERAGEGWRARIALACPSLGFDLASPLAAAVASRATSVYLPEGSSHMLPECLGTGLFSLKEKQPKPALVLECELDAQGRLLSCEPSLHWVQVEANLTYEAVEGCLDPSFTETCGRDASAYTEQLLLASELGQALRQARLDQGAVIIDRNEPELALNGEGAGVKVTLAFKPVCPLAQTLVSELMILANSSLAVWAMERELPLLFRTQNISLPKESNGIWRAPEDIHRVVKVLGSAVMEVKPRPHASLAVKAYAPISSPLRRYTDFINLIQTLQYLEQGAPRWSAEQLEGLLPTLNARLDAAACIQRFRPRYWKLVYLKQQGDVAHQAVLVEDAGRFVSASLPDVQIFIRGPKDLFGDKTYPGQPFKVRFNRIDPLNNDIHILDAVEIDSE